MKTNIEIDYFLRVDKNLYRLVYEMLDDNLIFGGD